MTVPASPQVEAALISRLLVDPAQVQVLAGTLNPDDFYREDNREAWLAMVELSKADRPIDILTIREVAGRDLDLPAPDFSGTQTAPTAEYAGILRDFTVRRRVVEAAEQTIRAAQLGDPVRMAEHAAEASQIAAAGASKDDLGLVDLSQFRHAPEPPWLGVLSPEGTTVLYGEGGDGKGFIAAKLAARLDRKVAILDFEQHPNEWAYRLDLFGMSFDDVLYISPPILMEKWADDRAARLLKSEDIGFLIIDSAMYAANIEDPYSPSSAMAYKRARARLGNMPALLLAHTAKAQNGIFGSVFWQAEARIVWHLKKDFMSKQRSLQCEKANNYKNLEGQKLIVEFDEDRGVLNLHDHGKPWTPEEDDGEF